MPAAEHEDEHADLIDALGRAGRPFGTETADLVRAGAVRGRQLRRRRAAALTGAVAAVAAAAVGGTLLIGAGLPHRTAGPAAPSPLASLSLTPTPSGPSGDQVLAKLRSLLPPGQVSQTHARTTSSDGRPMPPTADLVLDDGHGKSFIRIALNRLPREAATGYLSCPPATAVEACTSTVQSDGSVLTVLQGHEFPDLRKPTKLWQAALFTPDLGLIDLAEVNAPSEKDDPVSRTDPPLTPAQLSAIVTAGSWRPLLDVLPRPQGAGQSARGVPTGDAMLDTLGTLLPPGLTTGGGVGGNLEGYATLFAGDPGTSCQLVVRVEDWSKQTARDPRFGSVQAPPGGPAVVVEHPDAPANGGAVRARATAWWPDATLVAVEVQYCSDRGQGGGKADPLLTDAQLRAIVAAPVWRLRPAG
ncbi:hypothetical protein ACFW1A_16905 [Kitasatospora sp. NPDC058965]|uniref:hypothetical protein n=1 Tax=Kitasatospora sp. NPDC058965 TaxID=3346682 RepID=UPI003678C02C